MNDRQLKLGAFLTPGGEHLAAWRDETVDTGGRHFTNYLHATQLAEDALFDFVFLGDVAPQSTDPLEALSRLSWYDRLEPLTLLSALAVSTSHIGLVATASTTYNEPYHIARKLASIDQLSNGRAGWNVVTTMTASDALNFSLTEHAPLGNRYARAEEFVDVVRGLWSSWEEGAFIRDKPSGRYFDPAKLHVLHHRGHEFSVRGPLDIARSPQGEPVIVQAGSSESGRRLAARTAEVVFTSQVDLSAAQHFYANIRHRAAAFGRGDGDLVILNGLMPFVAETEAEARNLFDDLQNLIQVPVALSRLSALLGNVDLSAYPLDARVPPLPAGNGLTSRQEQLLAYASANDLTLRDLALHVSGTRGHLTLVGTARQVADVMQEWLEKRGTDGFLLLPPTLPDSLAAFTRLVVPELRERGIFRKRYAGRTLREHLGIQAV